MSNDFIEQTNDVDQLDFSTERSEHHPVSALLWEHFLKTSIPPESREESISFEKRQRGRPKRFVPSSTVGITINKMSDVEPSLRQLLPESHSKLILDFKEYVEEGVAPRDALEKVSELYKVPYCQAYNLCAEEF